MNREFQPFFRAVRMRNITIFLLYIMLFLVYGCRLTAALPGHAGADEKQVSIATWNVQALFDAEDTGSEYADFSLDAGWTEEKYAARLLTLSKAIPALPGGSPDVIAFQEVENSAVLETLCRNLTRDGYRYSAFSKNPGAALGIGIISRLPLRDRKVHSLTENGQTLPRPVLEVWVDTAFFPLVLLNCHWKSKLGGDEETEVLRRAAAGTALRRILEINASHPGTPVILMGDLNENHDEFYRGGGTRKYALMPDSAEAAAFLDQNSLNSGVFDPDRQSPGLERPPEYRRDFLILSGEKPPESSHFSSSQGIFYTPWEGEIQNGSYYYKGAWESIDHFLLPPELFDSAGWEYESCHLPEGAPFLDSEGHPHGYNPRTGSGLSDHLPVILTIRSLPGT